MSHKLHILSIMQPLSQYIKETTLQGRLSFRVAKSPKKLTMSGAGSVIDFNFKNWAIFSFALKNKKEMESLEILIHENKNYDDISFNLAIFLGLNPLKSELMELNSFLQVCQKLFINKEVSQIMLLDTAQCMVLKDHQILENLLLENIISQSEVLTTWLQMCALKLKKAKQKKFLILPEHVLWPIDYMPNP